MADKPEHVIEIPNSLGRDVDKAREGKIDAPPMEAFFSDSALQDMKDATDARDAPIHAEDIQVISHGEATQRYEQHGETLPSMPRMRRVIPAPFRRPRIAVEHHGKAWTTCKAENVGLGDIVPDVGRVISRELVTLRETVAGVPDVAVGVQVVLHGLGGARVPFREGEFVRVFRQSE